MSHYTVAVSSHHPNDVERLMASYEENGKNEFEKWDWYEVGGNRFAQMKLKSGEMTSQARFADIDFARDPEEYEKALTHWDELVRIDPKDSAGYLRGRYGTRERYADIQSRFVPFAAVMADGEWIAEGEMGWFGISDTTQKSLDTYLAELAEYMKVAEQQNLWVTMLDCHI